MKESQEQARIRARDAREGLGKLPPQALELEEGILGALMLEKKALSIVAILKPEDFYAESHVLIYKAICQLVTDSQPVDIITVTIQLRKSGHLELVGGAYLIAEIISRVSSSANIEAHAYFLKELAMKRDLIRLAGEIQNDAYDDETDVFDLLDRTDAKLMSINTQDQKSVKVMKQALTEMVTEIQGRQNPALDGITGVPSGFHNVDKITHGWQPSDLIIMASRPGMGKTSCAVSMMNNASIKFEVPTAIVSLEMATIQLVMKMASIESEIALRDMRSKKFDSIDWQQLTQKTVRLANAPIYIDDSSSVSIFQFRQLARKLYKLGVRMIVVDYIQLMKGDVELKKSSNREQEISSIVRGLKACAKELNIPIIALSQLSREVEKRGGLKIPQLSDLRESGSLEQDADIVIFLWRPEYYKFTGDSDGEFIPGLTKAIIAKHRNGSTGEAMLQFKSKTTAFLNAETTYQGQETKPTLTVGVNPDQTHTPKSDKDDMPF